MASLHCPVCGGNFEGWVWKQVSLMMWSGGQLWVLLFLSESEEGVEGQEGSKPVNQMPGGRFGVPGWGGKVFG